MMKSKKHQRNINMTNTSTDRFDKLEWIKENTPKKHYEMFLSALVNWLEEEEFNKFFEHHCRIWDIKTPFDENEA
jgi:hypothetical protein